MSEIVANERRKRKCLGCLVITIGVVFLVLGIALVTVGANFAQVFPGDYPSMQAKQCTIHYSDLVQCGGKWFPIFDDSVIIDAFSTYEKIEEAAAARDVYKFNQTYQCMCNADGIKQIKCGTPAGGSTMLLQGCVLNTASTTFLMQVNGAKWYAANACIAIGSLIMAFDIFTGVIIYVIRN